MSTLAPIWIPIQGVDKFSKEFKSLQKSVMKTSQGFKKAGNAATIGLSVPIAAAAGFAISSATKINESMANIATLMPGNSERVQELKKGIQSLSVEVGKAGTDLAEGMYQVVSAFGDSADSMDILTTSAKAAKAGLATTEESVNLLSAVTKGYGDTSKAAVKDVADLAFLTVKLGQTTFPELASSMGSAVPIANALNISQKELFASYATLTGVTGNASDVTTQLTSVMSAMVKPSTALTDTVKSLGFESASAMMKEKGLVGSIQLLNKAVGGNADYMAQMLGRKEALTAALALSGSQAEVFTDKMNQMQSATGSLTAAFKEQTEGVNKTGFMTQQAIQRISVAAQRMGDILLPLVAKILTPLSSMIERFGSLPKPVMATIAALAGVIFLAGPLLVVIGMLIGAWGALAGAIATAGGVAAVFMSPVILVVGGLLLLGLVVAKLWSRLDLLRTVIGGGLAAAMWFLAPVLKTTWEFLTALWSVFERLFIIISPIVSIIGLLGGALLSLPIAIIIKLFQGLLWVITQILKAVDWLLAKLEPLTKGLAGFMNMWKKTGKETEKGLPGVNDSADTGTSGPGIDLANMQQSPMDLSVLSVTKKDESKVTMDFKNVPTGVTITKEKGNVNLTSDNGAIMAGAL